MERSVKLQGQFNLGRDKRRASDDRSGERDSDPAERQAIVHNKLDMSRKELAGAQSNVRTSQGSVAAATDNVYRCSIDARELNTDAEVARQHLSEAKNESAVDQ